MAAGVRDFGEVLAAYHEARERHGKVREKKRLVEAEETRAFQAYWEAKEALRRAMGVRDEDGALEALAARMQEG